MSTAPKPYDWKSLFLIALAQMPVIGHACDAAGVHRSTATRAREGDEEFARAWDEAMATGIDLAEQAAFKRGVLGFEEPVIDKGRLAYRYERVVAKATHAEAGEEVETETWRMALDANGQPIPLTVRKHSDALLSLILKGRRKEVYADRTELAGVEGQPLALDSSARAARAAQLIALAQLRKDHSDLA
jgi:hypothetical protein